MNSSPLCRLELSPQGLALDVERGAPLADILFAHGVEFPCGGASLCGRCRVRVLEGELAVTPVMREALTDGEIAAGWRLACQARVGGPLKLEVAQWEAEILTDERRVPFEAAEGLGFAVDVGTTTLVVQAVDLATGDVLAVASAMNPQAAYGADVMSRVQFALAGERGASRLAYTIREAIGRLMNRTLVDSGRAAAAPMRSVLLAGNTVMHHLFCGESVEPLAHVPFSSGTAGSRVFTPGELGWPLPDSCRVEFLPCLGGFVGSDVLAGIVACGLDDGATGPAALIDLGTNGEIVLRCRDGTLLAASTAAGPAFEGGGISMGMRAGTGAIAHVRVRDGRIQCRVLGGDHAQAAGICGSGLVDAVAAGIALGCIAPDGRLLDGARTLPLAGAVQLTRGDIRELQLAKAAISSGLRLLAHRAAVRLASIETLHLAGAFGNYIDAAHAHRIGLLETPESRIVAEGNASLRGVRMLLLRPSTRAATIERILAAAEHVALVSEPGFQDTFVDCLALEEAREAS